MKKFVYFLPLALAAFSLASCKTKAPESKGNWNLIWNDEFDGSSLDLTKWSFQTGTGSQYGLTDWGNGELEYYTEKNVSLKKGNLIIEARKETVDNHPYTSSRIRTMKDDGTVLFAPTFGRVEARIKVPAGDGLWPAFWLLPADDKYGSWAASGEIDIMEIMGRLPNRVYGTLHYGQQWPGQKSSGSMYKFPDEQNATQFHEYALEWEPGEMRWYVDDNLFYKTSSWWGMGPDDSEPFKYPAPFDVPFYIVLNLAVGGQFDDYRIPEDYQLPAQMLVDYVRVYEKKDGYNFDVKRPTPPQDTSAFESYRNNEGNFILDSEFTSANLTGMESNTMDVSSSDWYFLTLSDFGGQAKAKKEDDSFHIQIEKEGGEVHSVQLLQHLGVAKGYTYQIKFQAKAAADRNITVKLGGDDDNKWAVYSSQYMPELTTEWQTFKYRFTMEDASDPSARLEFNVGKNPADVWIKDVQVISVE